MCRETGITFCGPLALGIFSLSCGDADTRCAAFEEAEAALAGGCVSHNYFWFYRVGAGYTVRLGDTRYRTGAGRWPAAVSATIISGFIALARDTQLGLAIPAIEQALAGA